MRFCGRYRVFLRLLPVILLTGMAFQWLYDEYVDTRLHGTYSTRYTHGVKTGDNVGLGSLDNTRPLETGYEKQSPVKLNFSRDFTSRDVTSIPSDHLPLQASTITSQDKNAPDNTSGIKDSLANNNRNEIHFTPKLSPPSAESTMASAENKIEKSPKRKGTGYVKSGVLSDMLRHINVTDYEHGSRSILSNNSSVVWNRGSLSTSFRSYDTSRYRNLLGETPPKYLPNYKNPCWKEPIEEGVQKSSKRKEFQVGRSWRLRCLPYFYVAGVHKAGTTDLFERLTGHPHITHFVKELHWWSWARSGRYTQRARFTFPANSTIRYYIDIFDHAARNIQNYIQHKASTEHHPMIMGEGCPSYLWYSQNWKEHPEQGPRANSPRYLIGHYIHHVTPNARIIFSFRNPTEREYSFYKFMDGSSRSPNNFHKHVATGVPMMEACIEKHSAYHCATNDELINKLSPLRLHMGMYAVFLKIWMDIFPWQQIYISRLEDYSRNKAFYLNDIFEFLGVGKLSDFSMQQLLEGEAINNNDRMSVAWGPMFDETKQLLDDFFRPFNLELAELLQDNRFTWQD